MIIRIVWSNSTAFHENKSLKYVDALSRKESLPLYNVNFFSLFVHKIELSNGIFIKKSNYFILNADLVYKKQVLLCSSCIGTVLNLSPQLGWLLLMRRTYIINFFIYTFLGYVEVKTSTVNFIFVFVVSHYYIIVLI